MNVLVIACLGILVVLSGILVIRLHPLLALILGALFVLIFTPRSVVIENEMDRAGIRITEVGKDGSFDLARNVVPGEYYLMRGGSRQIESQPLVIQGSTKQFEKDYRFFTSELPTAAFEKGDRLLAVGEIQQIDAHRWSAIGARLAGGLADTFRKIGLPITMAAVVGICLLESGAAARLIEAIRALLGKQRTIPALSVSGFILGIPVFFDTVFYMLLPLAKAFGRKDPRNYVAAIMAIIVGATMAHSLVPPTPGPMLVAAEMGVSIGMMMIGGTIVGGLAATFGMLYGLWCNTWLKIDLQAGMGTSTDSTDVSPSQEPAVKPMSVWLAALPIGLPLLMLGGSEMLNVVAESSDNVQSILISVNTAIPWLALFADPGIALLCAALVSMVVLRKTRPTQDTSGAIGRGLSDAGMILLLTCSGGAFGASLQQIRIAQAVGEQFPQAMSAWGILVVAFLLTVLIRIAQGSATVAMITAAGIVKPIVERMLETDSLPFHPMYIALAIGCGSKPIPWMNDSGFWQIATMTGFTTTQTLRTVSVAVSLMGCIGFAITALGAWLFPLN